MAMDSTSPFPKIDLRRTLPTNPNVQRFLRQSDGGFVVKLQGRYYVLATRQDAELFIAMFRRIAESYKVMDVAVYNEMQGCRTSGRYPPASELGKAEQEKIYAIQAKCKEYKAGFETGWHVCIDGDVRAFSDHDTAINFIYYYLDATPGDDIDAMTVYFASFAPPARPSTEEATNLPTIPEATEEETEMTTI